MPRNGSYLSVITLPFVSLWNAVCFVLVTLLWSNLFGTKKKRKAVKGSNQVVRTSYMASRSPRDRKPYKSQNSVDETEDGLPREIANLRAHHKQAYGYIAKALEIDEEGGTCTQCTLHM